MDYVKCKVEITNGDNKCEVIVIIPVKTAQLQLNAVRQSFTGSGFKEIVQGGEYERHGMTYKIKDTKDMFINAFVFDTDEDINTLKREVSND